MKHVLSLIVSTDQGIMLGQVFKAIASKDRMSRSELLQLMSNRIRARELDELLVTLKDSGYIEDIHNPDVKGTWYRKRIVKPGR
jgi:ribosomal protein S8